MSERSPTLGEAIRLAIQKAVSELRVMLPAKVVRFDAEKNLVDVKPLLKEEYEGEDGETVVESLPVITNVPVSFMGFGNFRIVGPLSVGDTGSVVFADRSLDVWLQSGDDVDPRDGRRHNISDAVFFPGLNPVTSAWTVGSSMSIGVEGGTTVDISPGSISLDGGSTPVAKVGSSVQCGPFSGSVLTGSNSVKVP